MKSPIATLLVLIVAAYSALAPAQSVTPPAGGAYVIQKSAIAAGGQRGSGGSYVLTGTVAQATAGPLPADAAGGTFRLAGGFHVAVAPAVLGTDIFRNGFEN